MSENAKNTNTEIMDTQASEGEGFLPIVTKVEEIASINVETALAAMTEEDRKAVLALADSIDITQIEKVLNYGSEPLRKTFEQTGEFLKSQKGSQADQEVMKMVLELSKQAKESYDDFQLELKEPNFIEKLLLSMSAKRRGKKSAELPTKALNSYSLLMALKKQSENWLELLKEGMGTISLSMFTDAENEALLEKYIIAGVIAAPRLEAQISEAQQRADETGLGEDSRQLMVLQEGYEKFTIKVKNLNDSRAMYKLSQAQLSMIQKSNYDTQCSIHVQSDNAMTAMAIQLRNAVLNQQTQDVIAGQKAIVRLNDELVQAVSENIGVTGEQAKHMLYAGVFNVDAAIASVKTVMDACEKIKATNTELYPKMVENSKKLNELVEELKPFVEGSTIKPEPGFISEDTTTNALKNDISKGGLKF